MKFILPSVWLFLLLSISGINASIWIKNVKSYGPSAAANGVKCLITMSKFYLKDPSITRSQNLVVSFTRNLTVPADNIQRSYLKWMHQAIAKQEMNK